MINLITPLLELNYANIFVGVFIILIGAKAIYESVEFVCTKILKIEFKKARERREEHELLIQTAKNLSDLETQRKIDVEQSISHDKAIKDSVIELSNKVDSVSESLVEMKKQQDEDKRAEYKDKIGEGYRLYISRKYSVEKPIPYWNYMEKEAMEGLIKQYESHGGSNSFVHSVVEKEMETWILEN